MRKGADPSRTCHTARLTRDILYLYTDTHTQEAKCANIAYQVVASPQSAWYGTIGLPFRLRPHTVEMEPAAPEAAPRPSDPRQSRQ